MCVNTGLKENKMKAFYRISILLLMVMLIAPSNTVFGNEEKILPSVAKQKVNQDFRAYTSSLPKDKSLTAEEWYGKRQEITLKHLATVNTSDLSMKELFAYGELLSWAKKNEDAISAFSTVAKGNDVLARNASKRILSIHINDENQSIENLRAKLNDFRKKHAPAAISHAHDIVMARVNVQAMRGEGARADMEHDRKPLSADGVEHLFH